LIKSTNSDKNVIASLQLVGVDITYAALMKRVARASVEDHSIAEIIIPNLSAESMVSSMSPRKQANDSLTSENTAETTSHEDQSLGTPELQSSVGGRPTGSTKAKKKNAKETESKCTDAITFEYSRQYNTSKSVGRKVEYGYLKRLIDEKKKEFGINISISSRTIKNRIQRGSLPTHHQPRSRRRRRALSAPPRTSTSAMLSSPDNVVTAVDADERDACCRR
jgi:hypothetical protein